MKLRFKSTEARMLTLLVVLLSVVAGHSFWLPLVAWPVTIRTESVAAGRTCSPGTWDWCRPSATDERNHQLIRGTRLSMKNSFGN